MSQNSHRRSGRFRKTQEELPPPRWYHWPIFPRFALMFFLVGAIPVVLSTWYVVAHTQILLEESRDGVARRVVELVDTLNQRHLENNDAIVDLVNQGIRPSLEKAFERISREEQVQLETTWSTTIQRAQMQARQHLLDEQAYAHQAGEDLSISIIHAVAGKIADSTIRTFLPIIVLISGVSIGGGILGAGYLLRPLKEFTVVASQIARGNTAYDVPVSYSYDELGQLSRSFRDIIAYLGRMVQGAQQIAQGNFTIDVTPLSSDDALGNTAQEMVVYLREIAALATAISHGNLDQMVTPKSEADVLGQALHRMSTYLQEIARVAHKVAGGDLSEQPQSPSEEDMLGNAFADMIVKLRHLVSKIRLDANHLTAMSHESQNRATEEAESVEKISLAVEETSSSMTQMAVSIEQVNHNMQGLASFVGETSSSIEEMTSSIRQIVQHSEQLGAASEETSTSIQEIASSLQQFAKTAQHSKRLSDGARQDAIDGRDSVEKMVQSMHEIYQMATDTTTAIQSLNTRTESIQDILGVIKDISDQTSLLSINAAIIAKKAGEQGQGFTVIADNVRRLAERSHASAKEIALIIRDVRKEAAHAVAVVSRGLARVQEGVNLAELAGQALEKIIAGANESSTVVAMIADTTDEQTRISQHIMASMEHVVEMISQIKKATMEQEKSSSYIMKQAEQILLSSQQVKQSTAEQTGVVKHVSHAMDDVRHLIQQTSDRAKESTQTASRLAEHATALEQLVSQFTI